LSRKQQTYENAVKMIRQSLDTHSKFKNLRQSSHNKMRNQTISTQSNLFGSQVAQNVIRQEFLNNSIDFNSG
jgi:hypothetical protein